MVEYEFIDKKCVETIIKHGSSWTKRTIEIFY